MRIFVLLWTGSQAAFWLAWGIGYFFLPDQSVRGAGLAFYLPLETLPFERRVAGIVLWNAVIAALVAGANLVRWGRLPLGVLPVVSYWVHYGLLLGTNSFAVPTLHRAAPSIATLLQRSGLFELTAYTLVAAATFEWGRWRQTGLLWGPLERLHPQGLRRSHVLLLLLAMLLLIGAAVREAATWMAVTGG
ncbi:MAG TPA: hypothetical protein VIN09_12910 [Chloroflexota bacterium]